MRLHPHCYYPHCWIIFFPNLIKWQIYITSIKVANTKNKRNVTKMSNNKSWWMCGETGTLVFPGRDVNWCCHCGKHFGGSSKVQHRITWSSGSPRNRLKKKKWKAETQTDVIILNYVLYLINVGNIFSYTEDPKIKKHTQNTHNSRLHQFTSHKNMFQAYDFHLISTKTICTENPKATI